MERLSAPERTREELRALMNGELGTAAGRGDLVRLAPRRSRKSRQSTSRARTTAVSRPTQVSFSKPDLNT